MDICIDFDGTCVTHEFPKIGKDIGAVPVLRKLVENGHRLILFTMRSDRVKKTKINDNPEIDDVYGYFLRDAINWFYKHKIPLYGIQTNPNQGWTTSPKAYAHLYIDDAALGCPLKYSMDNIHHEPRPFVDWIEVDRMLKNLGLY